MANAERVFKFVLSFLNHIYIRGCVLWYSACDMIYVIYTIKLDNLKSVIYRQKGFIWIWIACHNVYWAFKY